MPLVYGERAKTVTGFKQNIKKEIAAGKKPKQAVAIAYAAKKEKPKSEDHKALKVNGHRTLMGVRKSKGIK